MNTEKRHGRLGRWLVLLACVTPMLIPERFAELMVLNWIGMEWSPFQYAGILLVLGQLVLYPRLSRFGTAVLAVIAVMAMSTTAHVIVSGVNPASALFSFLVFSGPACVGIAVSNLSIRYASSMRFYVMGVIVLGAVFAAGTVLFSTAISASVGWNREVLRSVTPVGGAIATGAVLLLAWPVVAGITLRAGGPIRIVLAVLMAVAFVLTGSRAITAVAVLGFLLVLPVSFTNLGRVRTAAAVLVGITCVVVAGAFTARWVAELPAAQRIVQILAPSSDHMRMESLRTGLSLFKDRPVTGHGPGSVYPWTTVRYTSMDEALAPPMVWTPWGYSLVEPHNMLLMSVVEHGLPLALTGFVALLIWLGSVFRRHRLTEPILAMQALGVFLFLLQTVGSSHIFVNYRVATLFWAAVACLWLCSRAAEALSPTVVGLEHARNRGTE